MIKSLNSRRIINTSLASNTNTNPTTTTTARPATTIRFYTRDIVVNPHISQVSPVLIPSQQHQQQQQQQQETQSSTNNNSSNDDKKQSFAEIPLKDDLF
jgi:hypothetical protein